ncbi:MAG TPA: 3' terminal RNA ribose 2'-O-methyltransferase Hen1 [Polyangia bacterium]
MLLTITNTAAPATDLGFLLHKHPDRAQEVELSFGKAHVFYPEATEDRCTAAVLLDVDVVGLSRGRKGADRTPLEPYVNDRAYVASSFLSVAISRVLGTALAGRCEKRPELAARPLPLAARLSVVPCRGGERLLRSLFEPLGYQVTASRHPLDARFPEWGDGPYYTVDLRATCTLAELLAHLYVLVPVLDDDKHYYVGEDEIEKLLRQGDGWLPSHPERELIARRYLKHQSRLTNRALARLNGAEDSPADPDAEAVLHEREEEAVERAISLNDARAGAVIGVLRASKATSVVDLGCGEGRLLAKLLKEPAFTRIAGLDVSHRALERAAERLGLEQMPARARERITLLHGSLTYRDRRLERFDAATVIEVIEHLEPMRLPAFERALFEFARPGLVVVTTPNVEYNVNFPALPAGRFRHHDHRFEWTRAEFKDWAQRTASRFGYRVEISPVGPEHPTTGAPTQMGVFFP